MSMTCDLWRFAALMRIAHHIPGRVRLKLGDGADAAAVAGVASFTRSAAKVRGIRSVKVNPLARSCVVEYDPDQIPPSVWQDIADGRRSAQADGLLQALAEG